MRTTQRLFILITLVSLFHRTGTAAEDTAVENSVRDCISSFRPLPPFERRATDFAELPAILNTQIKRGAPIGGGLYSSAAFLKQRPDLLAVMLRIADPVKKYRTSFVSEPTERKYQEWGLPLDGGALEYGASITSFIHNSRLADIKGTDMPPLIAKRYRVDFENLVSMQDVKFNGQYIFPRIEAKILNEHGLLVGFTVEKAAGVSFDHLLSHGKAQRKMKAWQIYTRIETQAVALHAQRKFHGDLHAGNIIVDFSTRDDFEVTFIDSQNLAPDVENTFEHGRNADLARLKEMREVIHKTDLFTDGKAYDE